MTTTQNSLTTPTSALIVIDMQTGFLDPHWGEPHDLEGCRANVSALISAFAAAGAPIVLVRHDSTKPASPLRPDAAGNQLFAEVARAPHDLFVTKTVNSAFIGSPDLDAWLRGRGIDTIVLGGIQTNMCVETTARMGGNLGYRVSSHSMRRRRSRSAPPSRPPCAPTGSQDPLPKERRTRVPPAQILRNSSPRPSRP